jgi:ABC-type dipeptide/oligopeptide/nickel transport system permease subunit
LILFPGGVLVATLMAFNLVGDGLRDAWDVKGQ